MRGPPSEPSHLDFRLSASLPPNDDLGGREEFSDRCSESSTPRSWSSFRSSSSRQLSGLLHTRKIGIFREVAFGVVTIDQAAGTLKAQCPTSPSDAPSVLDPSGASHELARRWRRRPDRMLQILNTAQSALQRPSVYCYYACRWQIQPKTSQLVPRNLPVHPEQSLPLRKCPMNE